MTNHIRSPHDLPDEPTSVLVRRWSEARTRNLSAKRQLHPEDLFAELAYGARTAQEVTAGRWCVVADLLRTGAVESWAQIGTAMNLTEADAHDGFRAWIAGQVYLRQTSDLLGISESEANELLALAEAVAW